MTKANIPKDENKILQSGGEGFMNPNRRGIGSGWTLLRKKSFISRGVTEPHLAAELFLKVMAQAKGDRPVRSLHNTKTNLT
jgi:hypothetical protein